MTLRTTLGEVKVEVFCEDTPKTAENFLALCASGYYDGTCFHRVHGDFMAQGGDPKSRELGCEFATGRGTSPREIELEINKRHGFFRGAVCFAIRARDPKNGSQFFLLTSPEPDLGNFTCFGHVSSGMGPVDRLEYGDTVNKAVVLRK